MSKKILTKWRKIPKFRPAMTRMPISIHGRYSHVWDMYVCWDGGEMGAGLLNELEGNSG